MIELTEGGNEKVFNDLGIDKIEFCSKFYKASLGGDWPYATTLEELTRCVEALINHKPEPIHTITEATWIPYTKIVEARGAKEGDVVKYNGSEFKVSDIFADSALRLKFVDESDRAFGAFRIAKCENLLFQVKTIHTFI